MHYRQTQKGFWIQKEAFRLGEKLLFIAILLFFLEYKRDIDVFGYVLQSELLLCGVVGVGKRNVAHLYRDRFYLTAVEDEVLAEEVRIEDGIGFRFDV